MRLKTYIMRPIKHYMEGVSAICYVLGYGILPPLFNSFLISIPVYFISYEISHYVPLKPEAIMLWTIAIATPAFARRQVSEELTDSLILLRLKKIAREVRQQSYS